MNTVFARRRFLQGAAASVGLLALPSFVIRASEVVSGQKIPKYDSWKDVYRGQWTWDKVVRSTHHLNCWFQAHCSWDVYVKDGLVYREEQAGEYPTVNAALPDYNPRGCQKGGCFSERMYDPTRITHPMRRVGPRGGGKWERVSWKEALDDIADTYLDVTVNEGTDRTIWDLGPGIDLGVSMAAQTRFSMLTQSIGLDMDGEIGDSRRGTLETFGKIVFERSADDYFNSDLILFWDSEQHADYAHRHHRTQFGHDVEAARADERIEAADAELAHLILEGSHAARREHTRHQTSVHRVSWWILEEDDARR